MKIPEFSNKKYQHKKIPCTAISDCAGEKEKGGNQFLFFLFLGEVAQSSSALASQHFA